MHAMAGQGEKKIAASGLQSFLFGILRQKAQNVAAYARIAGISCGNDAGDDGRHPPIAPGTAAVERGEQDDGIELD